jgi:quinol monooxygenase YgiN
MQRRPEVDVPEPLIYVDTSAVRDGMLSELEAALDDLVAFIDANEPRIIAYGAYISEDGTQLTVVHVHSDSASLEFHMDLAGPVFQRFVALVDMLSIQVYGNPSERVLRQLRDKAGLLGSGVVTVQPLHAGLVRSG